MALTTSPARHPQPQLSALRMVRTPRLAFRMAKLLLGSLLLTPLLLLLPWQQTVTAPGQLIAFKPVYRQQTVKAPIDGRVMEWQVVEGSRVRKGDLLVKMKDPDVDRVKHLRQEKEAIEQRVERARQRVASFERQLGAMIKGREEAIKAAEKRLQMGRRRLESAKQQEVAAQANNKAASFQYQVQKGLNEKGLTSQLEYEVARQRSVSTSAEVVRAEQGRLASESEVSALDADLGKISNDTDAAIQGVQALRQAAEAEMATAQRDLAQINVTLNRQLTQDVHAPCHGWVFRIIANAQDGGQLVKAGSDLLSIVPAIPEDQQRVVELFVEGNDSPLIMEFFRQQQEKGDTELPRIPVRVQFEGWPAVQIIGWPSLAMGTFGGVVRLVDRTTDGRGRFRILVEPDPEEQESNPWPPDEVLRQGVRANGWVFLNRVTIGWELWRRLNGFPPVLSETGKGDAYSKPKIKAPS